MQNGKSDAHFLLSGVYACLSEVMPEMETALAGVVIRSSDRKQSDSWRRPSAYMMSMVSHLADSNPITTYAGPIVPAYTTCRARAIEIETKMQQDRIKSWERKKLAFDWRDWGTDDYSGRERVPSFETE